MIDALIADNVMIDMRRVDRVVVHVAEAEGVAPAPPLMKLAARTRYFRRGRAFAGRSGQENAVSKRLQSPRPSGPCGGRTSARNPQPQPIARVGQ